MGLASALALGGGAFALARHTSGKTKKARDNLAIAFPDQPAQWYADTTREIFRSLGHAAVELIKLEQIYAEQEQRIEYVLSPEARQHMESGAPTVFVTAHVGAWQVAPLITRKFGFTVNAIYAPESNPVMNDLMRELRAPFGDKLISSEDGPRPILKALKAGESIILALDTRPDTGKLLPFFGRDALSNTSAVGLALKANAALVMGRAERLPGARYRITVYPPIESPNPEADIKEQAAAMTEVVHAHFEQWITETPGQWICLKRRWPKANKL